MIVEYNTTLSYENVNKSTPYLFRVICVSAGFGRCSVAVYPASRVSFDLPRQIGKRKETLRAASRFFDPPLIRENG